MDRFFRVSYGLVDYVRLREIDATLAILELNIGSCFMQTLDLQYNRIKDPRVVDVVSSINDLRVLYLQGNPVVKHVRHYRKTIVSSCTTLKYLDDR